MNTQPGNCYAATEAMYYLLGGKAAGYTPMVMHVEGGTHWFLRHRDGLVIDPTACQFKRKPDYSQAHGTGFLTSFPSRAARHLMNHVVWKRPWEQPVGWQMKLSRGSSPKRATRRRS